MLPFSRVVDIFTYSETIQGIKTWIVHKSILSTTDKRHFFKGVSDTTSLIRG